MFRSKIAFAIMIVVLQGCAYLSYLKDPFEDIPAFGVVIDGVYRGGFPKANGYARLKDLGVKTIVNFSGDNIYTLREEEIARKYGFDIVRVPLSIYKWPEDDKVLLFLKTILDVTKRPVFIHCTNGRDRTGAMVCVYRVIVEKKGPKEAYKEALNYGFWPYRGEVVLKKYIHQLKDRKPFYDYVNSLGNNGGK